MTKVAARARSDSAPAPAGRKTPREGGRRRSLAGNQAVQALARQGAGPGISEGPGVDRALAALASPGASLGRSIFLARGLPEADRERVLAHEARHVAQLGGRETDRARPVTLGSADDRWERDAAAAGPPLAGADPQVLRRYPNGEESSDENNVCEPDEEPVSRPQESEDTDAGTCELDTEEALTSSTEPLTSLDPGTLTCEPETPEEQVCMPPFADASFDPEAVDVEGMRNDMLNSESLRVDEWLGTHGETSPPDPDRPAYRRLQQRLRAERAVRVQTGHLWMTTAVDPVPDELLMLQASSGETIIIRVHTTYAAGPVNESTPGPIMTRQQFEDHLAGMGIPILTEEEYIERLRQTAAEIAPELLAGPYGGTGGFEGPGSDVLLSPGGGSADDFYRFHGYTGQQGRLDPLSSSILETYPWSAANRSGRMGEIGEGFALRQWGPHGARGFDSGRLLWSGHTSPRVWQSGGEGGYVAPRGLDLLRPFRRGRDATPAVDIDLANWRGGPDIDPILASGRFDAASVKVSMVDSPSMRARYGYYLGELAALNDTQRNNLALFRDLHRPGASLDETAARIALAVPESHAAELRTFLRDPLGVDASAGGGTALTPNWAMLPRSGPRTPERWEMRPHYATTALATPFDVGDGGAPLRTGADVLAARRAGRIDEARFNSLLRDIGDVAAQRVVGFAMAESALGWHQSYRESLSARTGRDLRAAFSPEMADVLEAERRLAGSPDVYTSGHRTRATLSVSHRTAVRGSGLSTGISLGVNLLSDPNAILEDPEYRQALLTRTAIEAGATYAGDFGEAALRSRVGFMAAEEGLTATAPRLLTGRIASRALPGLADVALEGYDIWTEEREHSTTEVVVRTGRAAVIGAGAAYAGAAIGTVVGGPVGFVVGLGAGALVGWLGSKIVPFGREHWEERQHEIARAAEAERRRQEYEQALAAERARVARLNLPLSGESASTVGVEGLYGLPVTNPMFLACEPGVEPTVGELEREYLLSVLMQAERSGPTLH